MTKINKASHKAIKKKCSGSQTMDFKKGFVNILFKVFVWKTKVKIQHGCE
jgi:hypothetical protein